MTQQLGYGRSRAHRLHDPGSAVMPTLVASNTERLQSPKYDGAQSQELLYSIWDRIPLCCWLLGPSGVGTSTLHLTAWNIAARISRTAVKGQPRKPTSTTFVWFLLYPAAFHCLLGNSGAQASRTNPPNCDRSLTCLPRPGPG